MRALESTVTVMVALRFQPRHHHVAFGGMLSFFRAHPPVGLAPGEGTHLEVLGDLITLLVSGTQTNGAFTILSDGEETGAGPLEDCTWSS
jgi:hypothetical protein